MTSVFLLCFFIFYPRLESPPIMHFSLHSFIVDCNYRSVTVSILFSANLIVKTGNRSYRIKQIRIFTPALYSLSWPEVHREPNHISVASPSPLFCHCIVVLFTSETNTIFIHDSSQSAGKINICFLLMKSMFLKWVVLFRTRPQITCIG